jgi:hypothetical protein
MPEALPKILLPLSVVLGGLFVFYRVLAGSVSSNAYLYLAGLIGLEILLMAVWNFAERFLPVLLISFLCAGLLSPFRSAFITGRWGVLAVGAIAGFVLYMKNPLHSFGAFHLTALFSVIAALVSAVVSNYPRIALLKTLSLLLVFLYGAAGARLAVVNREAKFCWGLLWACEVLVYISAFSYFAVHFPLYGNPNSLGVVMGVIALPPLLWGVIVSEGTPSHKRRLFALALCVLLLLSSYARAAIAAACVSSLLLTLALRRYRLLMKGAALALLGALLIMVISPLPEAQSGGGLVDRLTDTFFYKGKREQGVFSSRKSPWELATAAVRQHSWFGTGFGTSVTAVEGREQQDLSFASVREATREHGNSYFAILEWTGLFGAGPFYFMVLMIAFSVGRVTIWLRRTGNPFSPAVPIAAVLAGGLIHAAFEDWMFAVGYYMCIFFWVLAFILLDVLPVEGSVPLQAASASPQISPSWDHSPTVTVSGR